jgi:tetratricopeptide (TPR) repeat protein/DNA-binding SARP family transcriptional activator/DNA-binding XRE family transcriptional regulator
VTDIGPGDAPCAGELLRTHRTRQAMTQRELASKAGLSVRTLRDIELNRVRPRAESVRLLTEALSLPDADHAALLAALAPPPQPRATGLHIAVLGPLSVHRDGVPVELAPTMLRDLLALLALHPGQVVRREEIIDALWGEHPPRTHQHLLHVYIGRLRALAEPARQTQPARQTRPGRPARAAQADRAARPGAGTVRRAPGGYRLDLTGGELDLARFDGLVARAKQARDNGDPAAAEELLDRALACWRGSVLGGADTRLHQHPSAVAAARRRVAAALAYADLALDSGHCDHLVDRLRPVAADDPLHEGLAARLVLALAGNGEQGAALAVFDDIRRRLDEELGLTPGADLVDAQLRVLRHQLPAADRADRADRVVPAQLPADVATFTGRAAELADLDRLLPAGGPSSDVDSAGAGEVDSGRGSPATAVVISAVSGTAGVGKTALAVRWSHRVAGRFGDGQLYVDLRGYDPAQPVPPADALAGFLSALGLAGQDIPLELADRAARYRTELAGRRMLVVLDNASSAEQVRPLLPGAASCLVLVTSRDALPGLVSREGAYRLDLDLLPLPDAVALLRRLVGARVDAEPAAAAALAERCARLPLALRVAAERVTAHPATSLARLVDQLADQHRRLDLLAAGGDPRTAVRAVFSWSYQHLGPDAGRAFRLVGLHPAADLDAHAAAALVGSTVETAADLLDTLARAHLLRPAGVGRYGMHDLLRAYATGLAGSHDGDEARRAALTRLFDYYLGTAAAALDAWYPGERHRRPRVPAPATPTPTFDAAPAARAWLDAERGTLATICAHTADHGWPAHTTALAATLYRYLVAGGHHPDAVTIHTHAGRAAERTGDPAGQASAQLGLGTAQWRFGRYGPAAEHFQQAAALFQQAGDQVGEARALDNLGGVYWRLGRYEPAVGHLQRAVTVFRRVGDQAGEARALILLGYVDERLGRLGPAAEHLQLALTLLRQVGDTASEAAALTGLGMLEHQLGNYRQAADHHRLALTLHRQNGDRAGEGASLTNLGDVHTRLGQYEQASTDQRHALALFRETGNRYGEACALNGLGEVLRAAGQPDDARAQHTAALAVTADTGDRDETARAHNGLAHSHLALGHPDRARAHWQEALTCYTALDMPDAAEVRTHLAALDRAGGDET